MGFTQRPAWHDYTSPDLGQKRDEAVERKSATKRHLIQKTGEATLMQHCLQNWAIIECQKSSAQCIREWLTRQIVGSWVWEQQPIRGQYLGHVITLHQSESFSFLFLLSDLWRCHWVFLQQTHFAFAGDLENVQQQHLWTHEIWPPSHSFLSQGGQWWMHSENAMLKIFKSVRESARVLCCLFLGMPCSGWSGHHDDGELWTQRASQQTSANI